MKSIVMLLRKTSRLAVRDVVEDVHCHCLAVVDQRFIARPEINARLLSSISLGPFRE